MATHAHTHVSACVGWIEKLRAQSNCEGEVDDVGKREMWLISSEGRRCLDTRYVEANDRNTLKCTQNNTV